ncbi:MAG: polysaccharide lyase family 1 protein [Pseudomonadota bacterium]
MRISIKFIIISLVFYTGASLADSLKLEAENAVLNRGATVSGSHVISDRKGSRIKFEIGEAPKGEYRIQLNLANPTGKMAKVRLRAKGKKAEVRVDKRMTEMSVVESPALKIQHRGGNLSFEVELARKGLQFDGLWMTNIESQSSPEQDSTDSNPASNENKDENETEDTKIHPPTDISLLDLEEREQLIEGLQGFGQGTTGGLGGEVCVVTSLESSGDNTLRDCNDRGNSSKWIVFAVSGTLHLKHPIKITANTTIDGRGQSLVITGKGLYISNTQNVILHNLTIRDIENDDAVKIYNSKNVWIDHLTLANAKDGLLDITNVSHNITVSWTRLTDHNKTMLIGSNPKFTEDKGISVTLHHNFFYNTTRRNPLIRHARVHMFNNVLKHWGQGNTGDGVNATHGSQLRSENNMFQSNTDRPAMRVTIPNWEEIPGYIHESGSRVSQNEQLISHSPEKVFNPSSLYSYQVDTASSSLQDYIEKNAGAYGPGSGPLSYSEVYGEN